jgi:hypothetical protein
MPGIIYWSVTVIGVLLTVIFVISFYLLPFFIFPWIILMIFRKVKHIPQNEKINNIFYILLTLYITSVLVLLRRM